MELAMNGGKWESDTEQQNRQ